MQLAAPLLLALRQKTGNTADYIVHDDFQIFLHLQGQVTAPLKEDVGRVGNTDHNGAAKAATEAEPEARQDDRQIVKSLENVMQIVKMQRRQIVEQADAQN